MNVTSKSINTEFFLNICKITIKFNKSSKRSVKDIDKDC